MHASISSAKRSKPRVLFHGHVDLFLEHEGLLIITMPRSWRTPIYHAWKPCLSLTMSWLCWSLSGTVYCHSAALQYKQGEETMDWIKIGSRLDQAGLFSLLGKRYMVWSVRCQEHTNTPITHHEMNEFTLLHYLAKASTRYCGCAKRGSSIGNKRLLTSLHSWH